MIRSEALRKETMKTKRPWGMTPAGVAVTFLKRLALSPASQRRRPGSLGSILTLALLSGVLEVGRAQVPDPRDPWPTNTILNCWYFTDTTNWLSQRGYPPLSFTNLAVSDLGAGTAVVLDSPDPAWLQYNVIENNGATNLAVDQGSLMFWFAPNWASPNEGGTGPGQWARLIEAGSYTTNASYGWWSLYVDPDGVNLYFAAQTNDFSSNLTVYVSYPISWTTNPSFIPTTPVSKATSLK